MFQRIFASGIFDLIPKDLTESRGIWSDDRFSPAFWNIHVLESFRDQLTQKIDIVLVLKKDRDITKPKYGVGHDQFHSCHSGHCRLYRIGDELFDVLGGVSWAFCIDDHLFGSDVWKSIDRDFLVGLESKSGDGDKGHNHQNLVFECQIYNFIQHDLSLMTLFAKGGFQKHRLDVVAFVTHILLARFYAFNGCILFIHRDDFYHSRFEKNLMLLFMGFF